MNLQKMTDSKIKHLQIIQDVITRMNRNSFQIKGVAIAVLAGVFTVYSKIPNNWFLAAALIPTIFFWILDSYYLHQERKYIGLYNDLINDEKSKDIKAFTMDVSGYTWGRYMVIRAMFVSVNSFAYLTVIALLSVLIIVSPVSN